MLLEPSVALPRLFRVTRVGKGSPRYKGFDLRAKGTAGLLDGAMAPPNAVDQTEADDAVALLSKKPFKLFDSSALWLPAGMRIARSRAFLSQVLKAYGKRCAFCGQGGRLSNGRTELEAAHIVSRGKLGPDDVRNGLALCRAHHWAFDRGVIRISAHHIVQVEPAFALIAENATIASVDGEGLHLPLDGNAHPHPDALEWHRANVAFK